jgi:hypothetical protein
MDTKNRKMKRSRIIILVFVVFPMFFWGCIKEATIPTALKIIVKDESGNLIKGASVKIYYSAEFEKTVISDSKGAAEFTDLPVSWYCIDIKKGCLSYESGNTNAILFSALIPNKINVFTYQLEGEGRINFNNDNPPDNPIYYTIYVEGPLYTNFNFEAAAVTDYYGYYPVGFYTVRVERQDGIIIKTVTGTLTCGGTLDVSFSN